MLLPYGRALYHSCDSISSCCCHMAEHCTIHVILSAHAGAIWPSTVPLMWFYQLMLLPYGRALYHLCDSISSCWCHMAEHCTIHVILSAHAGAIWPSTVPFMWFYQLMLLPYGRALYHSCDSISSLLAHTCIMFPFITALLSNWPDTNWPDTPWPLKLLTTMPKWPPLTSQKYTFSEGKNQCFIFLSNGAQDIKLTPSSVEFYLFIYFLA